MVNWKITNANRNLSSCVPSIFHEFMAIGFLGSYNPNYNDNLIIRLGLTWITSGYYQL